MRSSLLLSIILSTLAAASPLPNSPKSALEARTTPDSSSDGTLVFEPAAPRSINDADQVDAKSDRAVVAKRGVWDKIENAVWDVGCFVGDTWDC